MTAPGPAPCRAACPVGTDAAAYVALLDAGRLDDAYDVARAPNPFPSICGRVCAAPCERACRRGRLDAPVAIRALKRVLTEAHGVEAAASRWHRGLDARPPADGPSVGIVGAGPAGLSAAHDLRLTGHRVTLYERAGEAGGMLLQGIPPFRLARRLLALEIQAILDLGVTLRTGCDVGADVGIEALFETHDAVLVAGGCPQGHLLELPGVQLSGVLRAVDFLRRVHAGEEAGVPGPVVVVGGGGVAFDAARSAWRLNAAPGSQAMVDAARTAARSRPAGSITMVAAEDRRALPVPPEELAQAEEEGVGIRAGWGIRRLVGDAEVEGVEVAPVRRLVDDDGRFAPELDEGRAEVMPARTVILAIGQRSDTAFLDGLDGLATTPWGGIQVDDHGRTGHPRLFAAGDVASGPGDLIDAIAAGQRAAASIVWALRGAAGPPPPRALEPPPVFTAPAVDVPSRSRSAYDAVPRVRLPVTSVAARAPGAEVEGAMDPGAVTREAARCLRCDAHLELTVEACVACGLCVDVCPHGCLSMEPAPGGVALSVRDDACVRCGLCVARCPAEALSFAGAGAR
jgi:formate dehydrogenase beta subunit